MAILNGKIYAISGTAMYYVGEINTEGGNVEIQNKMDMLEAVREVE